MGGQGSCPPIALSTRNQTIRSTRHSGLCCRATTSARSRSRPRPGSRKEQLGDFLEVRRRNAGHFVELFGNLDYVRIQRPIGDSSWFGFSLILEGPLAGQRDEVVRRLMAAGVECRPIVAGDFTKNPVIRYFDYRIHGDLKNTAKVDRDGFFVGNHHYDISEELSALKDLLEEAVSARL